MNKGFTRGLLVGSLIGASVNMMMNTDVINGRMQRKMMRSGKKVLRKTGNWMNDVSEIFR